MNKKKLAIFAFVASILSILTAILAPASLIIAEIFIIVGIILAIVAVILGFICVKDSKGFSIAAIIIGILSAIFLCLTLLGLVMFGKVTDCVDNGDGTANCMLFGEEVEDVPTDFLTDDQMKKQE